MQNIKCPQSEQAVFADAVWYDGWHTQRKSTPAACSGPKLQERLGQALPDAPEVHCMLCFELICDHSRFGNFQQLTFF